MLKLKYGFTIILLIVIFFIPKVSKGDEDKDLRLSSIRRTDIVGRHFPFLSGKDSLNKGDKKDKDHKKWKCDGILNLKYNLKFTGDLYKDKSDQDISGFLKFNLQRKGSNKDILKFDLLGDFNVDIDGLHKGSTVFPDGDWYPFRDIYDTYDHNIYGEVFSGYVDYKTGEVKFRLGRQSIYKGEALNFDGAKFDLTDIRKFGLAVYGGSPTYFYESSRRDDWLGGVAIETPRKRDLKFRLDYVHITDARVDLNQTRFTKKDDIFILGGKYNINKNLYLYGRWSFANEKERRALIRGKWNIPDLDLRVRGSVIRQNDTLTDFSTSISPYYVVLTEYKPFYQYQLSLSKDLTKNVTLVAGTNIRELKKKWDEAKFNHSYERYYATLDWDKVIDDKSGVSLTIDKWNASSEDDIFTVGGTFSYKFTKKLKTSIGTDYSLYKYEYETQRERESVRSYFFKSSYKITKNWKAVLKYAWEEDNLDSYNIASLCAQYSW